MRVIGLQASNFKVLKSVNLAFDGEGVIKIGGKNGAGKSSLIDAIWVALEGKAVAPPKPVRTGEEECVIRLDLGDLIVTRKFTDREGKQTDSVKVESADGKQRFTKPETVLRELLGAVGFDPFEFVQMKPEAQADRLLQLVPLPIDLDELAEKDDSDFAIRRDLNRDAKALEAQVNAIPVETIPTDSPDPQALIEALGNAANTNAAIERERSRRETEESVIEQTRNQAEMARQTAERLRREADESDQLAQARDDDASKREHGLKALPELDEPVDTNAIREQLREAEGIKALSERQQRRRQLAERHKAIIEEAATLTAALDDRERQRQEALAKAKMPIEGLGFGLNEKGKPVVTFGGVPFEQASTAEQIRASTAIAMAANPELKVFCIKDGSLLDEDSLAIIDGLAAEEGYQVLVEVVATKDVGIVIENGEVRDPPENVETGAEKPKSEPAAKKKSAPAPAEGGLL